MDEAYAQAKKSGKPILANFTGSDWCGWCKRLTATVFSQPEFKTWADKNVVLLELDFPRRFQLPEKIQKQNMSMQQALRITGYPTVYLLDIDKDPTSGQYQIKAMGKTGYKGTVGEFTGELDGFLKG
jgi:protein disulfide-isomerase